MGAPLVRRRQVLAELDPKRDLNTRRGLYKRDPIVFEQENEAAVLEGLELGIYDFDEVMALTNLSFSFPTAAATRDHDISDDERIRFEGGGYERDDMSDEELMEGLGEGEDELLGDVMADEMGEEMGDDDEDDEHLESEDEMEDHAFNPAALGLKEINNLAHFGVSSHRPGNGVSELLSDDLDKYWQYVHVPFLSSSIRHMLTRPTGRMASSRICSPFTFCAASRSGRSASTSTTTRTSRTRRPISSSMPALATMI
jgi:anaphase-promoting complex subunit 10